MRSKILDEILVKIPLETRVKVTIESYFIKEHGGTFFMPLDENGEDLPEAVEANNKCFEMAKPLLESILDDIKSWKEDGCPK